MSEMIERVARAIWAEMSTTEMPGSWELLHTVKQGQMQDIARAVLAVIHEPTKEMIEVGVKELGAEIKVNEDIEDIWQAMIEEALK